MFVDLKFRNWNLFEYWGLFVDALYSTKGEIC